MSMDEELQRLSKPKGFGESEFPTFEELLLPEDKPITSREIIESYGKRLDLIRQNKDPDAKARCGNDDRKGSELSYKDLGDICNLTVPAIRDIIEGRNKSINMKICNNLAKYFRCTPYYLLGLTQNHSSILIDKKEFMLPFVQVDEHELLDTTQAGQWARIDPALFKTLEKVFHLDPTTREAIRKILDLITK